MRRAVRTWSTYVHDGVTDQGFANDLAQVISYGMAMAALRGGADLNKDNLISLNEARYALEETSPVISASLGPVLGVKGLLAQIANEVGAIERLVAAVDPRAVAQSKDPRGEPWLWFYEDFLRAFDPQLRQKSGVYYTPAAIVQAQVRFAEHLLVDRFDRDLAFGDKSVTTLDPACGSGTYPLAVVDSALRRATERRGPAGPAQIAPTLANNVIAFELLPGPYAVAHLRIGQRIAEASGDLIPPEVRVYLTDTLDDPNSVPATLDLWGDADVLAEERRRAQAVKREEQVMVVIGNPPYGRVSQESGAGGWITSRTVGHSLFDDILRPVNTIFSHTTSLYNLYVYFWRWALWKVFESSPTQPAIASFITASSWLDGPGFVGLRKLAQALGDEIWVVDLGGDSRAGDSEENVFDIQIPVAVVTIVRDAASKESTVPSVYYVRLHGSRGEKLAAISNLAPPADEDGHWTKLTLETIGDPMVPSLPKDAWHSMPALVDIFPWQMAGMYANRTWPISPSRTVLERRWDAFLSKPTAEERSEAFVTPPTGRNIFTRVRGLAPLANLKKGTPVRAIERYAYRDFDRQWVIYDPRVIALERPSLWASRSDRQLFFSTLTASTLGEGPALTVATDVPDRHHFLGSNGGKDVIPLYRDRACTSPNLTEGLSARVGSLHRNADPRACNPSPEDLAAYVYALLSSPDYYDQFRSELRTPGPRVPLTADPALFLKVRSYGQRLIWLHTYADRFTSAERPTKMPRRKGIVWAKPVTKIPAGPNDIRYDPTKQELDVGTGTVIGVTEDVWEFSVTRWKVLQRWLQMRTRQGVGRSANRPKPLDLIRPSVWEDAWNDELLDLLNLLQETVDLRPAQKELLAQVLAGPTISADELPQPNSFQRKEPKVN